MNQNTWRKERNQKRYIFSYYSIRNYQQVLYLSYAILFTIYNFHALLSFGLNEQTWSCILAVS